jgi:hypothetical protein
VDSPGTPLSTANEGYTGLILAQISPSHTRTSQAVGHMIHPAVHDADNISFGRKPCALWSLKDIRLAPYIASSQLICNTFPIQHDGARQLTQWLRKQGHLALSEQHQFPIIPHFICLLRRLRNIGPIPISTKTVPQPTLPSSLSCNKSRGPCDTPVAP